MTFAVIKTGGKQYKVSEGQVLTVEKLEHKGNEVAFSEVLLVAGGGGVKIGRPAVPGASVNASVLADGRAEKKIVFRFKAKTRYKKKKGHRQPFTRVRIQKISV